MTGQPVLDDRDVLGQLADLGGQLGDAAVEVAKARSMRFRALGDAADAILWERVMDIALNAEEKKMFDNSVAAVQGLIDACKKLEPRLA